MGVRKIHLTSIVVAALMILSARIAGAAPQQISCILTDTADQLRSESRPVVIIFDDVAKTLKAQEGSHSYTFGNVSVSNVAISGDVDNVILGIDRSSLGIVWQQYQSDKATIEFGQCRISTPPVVGGSD